VGGRRNRAARAPARLCATVRLSRHGDAKRPDGRLRWWRNSVASSGSDAAAGAPAKHNDSKSAGSSHRYPHLDALRALAVTIVVVGHWGVSFVPASTGVTIFFTISGFIIALLVLQERNRTGRFDLRAFYARRALKILPPLFAIIIVPTLILAAFRPVIFAKVAAQTFFIYNWTIVPQGDVGPRVLPGSLVLWSLAVEEQFYILFAITWLLLSRRVAFWSLLFVVSAAVIAGSLTEKLFLATNPSEKYRIMYGSDTRADCVALGILAALLYYRWLNEEGWHARVRQMLASHWVVVIASLLMITTTLGAYRNAYARDSLLYPLQSVSAGLVILFFLLGHGGRLHAALTHVAECRPVQAVGLASYSIYLAHAPLFIAAGILTPQGNPAAGSLWSSRSLGERVALLLVLGFGAGWLCYRVIERPLDPLRRRLRSKGTGGDSVSNPASAYSAKPA
jgi:peptidoglycan/LPS O-acetylase OafA/YrhL